MIDPITDAIPAELRARDQWVTWRAETRGGRLTKIPYASLTRKASSTDPDTWRSFSSAVADYETNPEFDGIGYVFSPDDPLFGVDLDKCRNPDTGEITPEALEWVEKFATYTEVSPSGTGLKLFGIGAMPEGFSGKRSAGANVEAYDHARYFTVTGYRYGAFDIRPAQEALGAFVAHYFTPDPRPPQNRPVASPLGMDDAALMERATEARNGAKLAALMAGNISGYPGASEADAALAAMLAFWTTDPAQIERIMRSSALARDKWDERRGEGTYLSRTIDRELSRVGETYSPPGVETTFGIGAEAPPKADPSVDGWTVLSVDQLFDLEEPEGIWLVDRVLVRSGIHYLSAPSGMGKSWVALDLCRAMVSGGTWLGVEVNPGAVLYIDEEMGPQMVRERLMRLGMERGTPFSYVGKQGANLGNPIDVARIVALCTAQSVALVVCDTLTAMAPGLKENEAEHVSKLRRVFSQITATGATILVLHHDRKGRADGEQPGHAQMRGSGDLPAMSDMSYGIGKKGDHYAIRTTKCRAVPDHQALRAEFEIVDDGGRTHLRVIADTDAHKTDEMCRRVYDALWTIRPEALSQAKLAETVGAQKAAVITAVENLVASEEVAVEDGPRGSKLYRISLH
ncbi:MAG: AAA family ATPase [Gemmatimonadetes bacterium]|nr:AAA family ATPase [Gemmatimonadota bacterium]